ncbi:pah4 homeobox protein encoded by the pah4 protein [Podospora aff. communis PSN243]|uniref:Pah4 homeobox protein encoded by the pah4 protein n=1 Tax=Podospora aff. communis PSN243 TaxID=3040156 RepID=A0AAV9GMT7_9PEZI|nr:pah4 homeobox protein encoded by the pah4 protein [Podospora aff. communis PSN243]
MDPQALSPASSSSPPSRSVELAGHDRPSSSNSNPALPPSSTPLPSNTLPTPSADSERHPKGKRKRTAAKDKAILEQAYTENPKPDKAARLAIVNRVSLNEKEVQIWFQNRRQNDRRKSRPLSAQEIAALRYGGMQILSSDPLSYNPSFGSDSTHTSPVQSMSRLDQGVASPPHSDPPSSSSCDEAHTSPCVPREPRRDEGVRRGQVASSAAPRPDAAENAREVSQSLSSSASYPSGTWNRTSSFSTPSTLGRRGEDSFNVEPFVSSSCLSSRTEAILPPPSKKSSRFRLSLSLEGKAEVVPSSSSPPRPEVPPPTAEDLKAQEPVRRLNLQRSHSASSPITLPPISVLTSTLGAPGTASLPPRLTRGRSRDVHAWEFACDSENRDDLLTTQAKNESSGSAIAAITLLRSTSSSGSALQPSSSAKRNAATSKAAPHSKKPKLSGTLSSAATLKSNLRLGNKKNAEKDSEADEGKMKVLIASGNGNESDKENWSPDEDGNPHFTFSQPHVGTAPSGRKPLPFGSTRLDRKNPRRTPGRFGQEHRGAAPPLGNRANTAPTYLQTPRIGKRAQSPLEIFEDTECTSPARRSSVDDEVERFMRGDVSPSKKGDVDAVAGLLSLSQGNWQ